MKKYLLLLLLIVFISCSEDDSKDDVLFNGTETYVFESEVEEVQVYDFNGKVEYPSDWEQELVDAKVEFDIDIVYNYTGCQINNDFLYLSDGIEIDTIPIIIENNQIFSNVEAFGLKIKIFDIVNGDELQNFAVMFSQKVNENGNISYSSESTNFSYTEYDEQFNDAKSNIDSVGYVALIKQKRLYSKVK